MNNKRVINEHSLFQQIHASPGMKFLNQLHARSFSLNIFRMNALELIEATLKVRDPEQGLALMSQGHKEAGNQAHRELNRHIHNFVAASKTLVDHTRVYIEENYSETQILNSYKKQISNTFANDPVSKFVHDLRNYMLHKGLPNSHMFMSFVQATENSSQGAQLTTGIRFDTESLLEWDGWTAPAKKYLEQSGKHLDIHQFVNEYLVQVNRFHNWLEALLREHHTSDLAQLAKLQELYATESGNTKNREASQDAASNVESTESQTSVEAPFSFSAQQAIAINEVSDALLLKVRELTLPPSTADKFPTQRPISAHLTEAEMIGTPIVNARDINGEDVIIFAFADNKSFGLKLFDLSDTENICDKIHATRWARNQLSRKFIVDEFLVWARNNFRAPSRSKFSDSVIEKGRKDIATLEIWAPIAHMEVESVIDFGPVKIAPITADKIDSLEKMGASIPPAQQEAARQLFDKMRQDIQGFAAIVVTLKAEPNLAEERGLMVAQDAVSLLRFFSPAASASWLLCPTALLGAEIVPRSKLLILSDSTFTMTDRLSTKDIAFWKLSLSDIKVLEEQGFRQAADLVSPTNLSDFSASVRSSLITYGKGTLFPDLIDRLTHTLSALEEVFLKHEMEPVESNIAARLGFLISKKEIERADISQNVRQVYRLSGQYRTSPLSPREQEICAIFVSYAHLALQIALQNIGTFQTKTEFVEAVDRLVSAATDE